MLKGMGVLLQEGASSDSSTDGILPLSVRLHPLLGLPFLLASLFFEFRYPPPDAGLHTTGP